MGSIRLSAAVCFLLLTLSAMIVSEAVLYHGLGVEILFDSDGVPMVNYGYAIGIHYNPITVCQYALEYYASGNSSFFVLAEWLASHVEPHGNYSLWQFNFNWPFYGHTLHGPWYSGMAQGLGIEVMLKAWESSGNETYLRVANSSLNALAVSYSVGGVRQSLGDESWWYLEYASPALDYHAYVLNGFIYALHGIYMYRTMIGGPVAENLW